MWVSQDVVPTLEAGQVFWHKSQTQLLHSENHCSPTGDPVFSIEGAEVLCTEASMRPFSGSFFSIILLNGTFHQSPNTTAFFQWHESLLHTVTVNRTKTGTQTQELDLKLQSVTHHSHSCGNKKALYSLHTSPLSVVMSSVPAGWQFCGILSLVQICK